MCIQCELMKIIGLMIYQRKKNMSKLAFLFTILVFSMSCQKSKDFSDIPYLEFRSFSKMQMRQGSVNQDSVILTLYFTDGDGDFGTESRDADLNIFMKDLRTGNEFRSFKSPFIPLDGVGRSISGTIRLKIFTTCCIFPPDLGVFPCERTPQVPTNSLPLEIFIRDRAGNDSNIVKLDPLTLLCQ